MIALDTSVLARYILNDNPAETRVAEALIAGNNCAVSWSVLVELCWVLQSNARLPKRDVVRSLTAILDSKQITVPDEALLDWAIERYASGADFPDMVHLASAGNGTREFVCFDRKLARQAGAETPLAVRTLKA